MSKTKKGITHRTDVRRSQMKELAMLARRWRSPFTIQIV